MDQLLIYTDHAFWVLLPLNYDISGSTSGSTILFIGLKEFNEAKLNCSYTPGL